MKKFLGVLLAGILILGSLAGCAKAEFEVSPVTITPSQVVIDEEFNASVDITNVGGADGVYTATLTIDGTITDTKEVPVSAGATEKVSFPCCLEAAGFHIIDLDGLTTTVTALKPAQFEVSSLVVSPDETVAGSSVMVMVDVANIGEAEGAYTVALKLDGEEVESREVTVAGGETETVSFTVMKDTMGIYNIEVNTLTGDLKVSPAAPAGYMGYADWENGFYIVYPEGWEQGEDPSTLVTFMGPMEEGGQPNFGVTKDILGTLITAEEFIRQTVELLKEIIEDVKLISTEELTINGILAARWTLAWSIFGADIKQQMVALITGRTCFGITLSSLSATYDKYADTFDTIVNSFIFLP